MANNAATEFDVVIIGGGPAGYAAALYGASAKLNIAIVEQDKVGGTCLHRGCIPAKELLESASVRRTIDHAADFGVNVGSVDVDWSTTVDRKQRVIDQMTSGLTQLLGSRKVTIFNGTAQLRAGHTVNISSEDGSDADIVGKAVVIATGSTPRTIPGFEPDGTVMTSDEFLDHREIPRAVAVIGGGAIGCEFASTLADVGSHVTIIEGLPKILPGVDKDCANVVGKVFKRKGIDIVTGVTVTGHVPKIGGGTTISYGEGETLDVDLVIVSVGRKPTSAGVVADDVDVSVDDRGFFVVDERNRTNGPGIWAIGDCIDTPQLAHVGFIEGINVIKDMLGEEPPPVDYDKVPWAIYCHPEVAFAGHSEASAKEAGFDIVTKKSRFIGNSRAVILGETDGLVKIIAEKDENGKAGRILGVHMVGPWVTEQLGQGYLAVNWEATVDEVASLIQPHPSMSELFGEAVLSLTGRSLH